MRLWNGRNVFIATLIVIYAAFWLWYGGRGQPMTMAEAEAYFAAFDRAGQQGTRIDRDDLRSLVAKDDGREFFMLNLIRHRAVAQYPDGYDFDGDVAAAESRYARGIVPALLGNGSMPVFLGEPKGHLIRAATGGDWDQVALVRYRSLRDLFRVMNDAAEGGYAVHKWASVEETHVLPVAPAMTAVSVRTLVAVVLIGLGLLLHLLLRRFAWYRPR